MEKLDKVINYILNSDSYNKCISIKEKMSTNSELMELIDEVKSLQKEYIKSNYNTDIKNKLDNKTKLLEEIPIYNIYIKELDKVNEMIDYVQDELNNYFYNVVN